MSRRSVDINGLVTAGALPLLATAIVQVTGVDGALVRARLLVDPASQLTLILSGLVDRLRLPVRPIHGLSVWWQCRRPMSAGA